jgi:hypothetical protein
MAFIIHYHRIRRVWGTLSPIFAPVLLCFRLDDKSITYKLKALRNESGGFCEMKKKHDSPTALRLFGRGNHASFLT